MSNNYDNDNHGKLKTKDDKSDRDNREEKIVIADADDIGAIVDQALPPDVNVAAVSFRGENSSERNNSSAFIAPPVSLSQREQWKMRRQQQNDQPQQQNKQHAPSDQGEEKSEEQEDNHSSHRYNENTTMNIGTGESLRTTRERRKQRKLEQAQVVDADDNENHDDNEGDEATSSLPGAVSMNDTNLQSTDGQHTESNRNSDAGTHIEQQDYYQAHIPQAELVADTSTRGVTEDYDDPTTLPVVAQIVDDQPTPAVNLKDWRVRLSFFTVVVVVCALVIGLATSIPLSRRGGGGDYIANNNNSMINTTDTQDPIFNGSLPPTTLAPTLSPTTSQPTSQPTAINWYLTKTIHSCSSRVDRDHEFGHSIELSRQGNHLVVGTRYIGSKLNNQTGLVRVYHYAANDSGRFNNTEYDWVPLGPEIAGETELDHFGYAVSMSDSGTTVAVSAATNSVTSANLTTGTVRVYHYNSTNNTWDPVGNIIYGAAEQNLSLGEDVSLSGDGRYVGMVQRRDRPLDSLVQVYALGQDGASWQLSRSFNGDALSLIASNATGVTYIAVGNSNEETYRSRGTVRVYRYLEEGVGNEEGRWLDVGRALEGLNELDSFGERVSLSDDANTVAIGSPQANRNGLTRTGAVIVYRYISRLNTWTQLGDEKVGFVDGELFGTRIALSANGQRYIAYSPNHGARRNDALNSGVTSVRAFQYDARRRRWVQLGDELQAEVGGEEFGFSLSIADNGGRIAISAPDIADDSKGEGYVKIYELESVVVPAVVNDTNHTLNWSLTQSIRSSHDGRDEFGHSIELSGHGNHLVVGTRFGDEADGTGYVRVYRYYPTIRGNSEQVDWIPLGPDIVGENEMDQLGYSVAISDSGTTIAMSAIGSDPIFLNETGSVLVYQYNYDNNVWNQLGNTIEGTSQSDSLGEHVSISSDGTFVGVIQSQQLPLEDLAQVYTLGHDGTWVLRLNITGNSLSLVTRPTTRINYIAVGSSNERNYRTRGTVRIYRYSMDGENNEENGQWLQIGPTIEGRTDYTAFGLTVSLSDDAMHVAIGSPQITRMNGTITASTVVVYRYIPRLDTWSQMGDETYGIVDSENFGNRVSISSNGQRYIVSSQSRGNESNGTKSGITSVRAYQYDPVRNMWVQLGTILNAEVEGEEFGFSISMSADGSRIAVSAPGQFNDSIGLGYVSIYDLEEVASPQDTFPNEDNNQQPLQQQQNGTRRFLLASSPSMIRRR